MTGRYEPFKTTVKFNGTSNNPEWIGCRRSLNGQERATRAVGGPHSNNENDIPHVKMGGTSRRLADKRFRGALTGQQQTTFELHAGRHSRELFDRHESHDRG